MLRVEIYYHRGAMPRDEEKRYMQDWCMEEAEAYIEKRQRLAGFKRGFIYLTHESERVEIKRFLPL